MVSAPDVKQGPTHWQPDWLWFYVTVAGSLSLRTSLFDFESGDFRAFLSPWYDIYIEHGRWRGLAVHDPQATYPPLYFYFLSLSTLLPLPKLYAIKLISLIGDYIAAWYVWQLTRHAWPPWSGWIGLTSFLFLPTVVMNGALWGQCDVLYTAGLLASLHYFIEKRPNAALVAFGFSCALKPQAVFWGPLLAGLLVARRWSWKSIWIPPAVYLACGVPAIAAGRPVLDVIWHWGRIDVVPGLTLRATNWYQWVFEQHPEVFWWPGIILTLVGTAFFVLWARMGKPPEMAEDRWLVSLALLSTLFAPFFLPGMHERYFFAADVLSVVYAVLIPKGYRVALLVQFASAFSYLPFSFNEEPIPLVLLPLAIMVAIGLVVKDLAIRFQRDRAEV